MASLGPASRASIKTGLSMLRLTRVLRPPWRKGSTLAFEHWPCSRILIAGGFGWQSGSSAGIALLQPDGTVVPEFAQQLSSVIYITALARQYDGKFVLSMVSWETGAS